MRSIGLYSMSGREKEGKDRVRVLISAKMHLDMCVPTLNYVYKNLLIFDYKKSCICLLRMELRFP